VLPGSSSVPPAVALARPAARLPTARDAALWFEPKWDGYRLTIVRDERTTLWSRQGKDLTVSFPEIAAAAEAEIPSGCVLDGELVIWSEGRLSFDSLQRRVGSRALRAKQLGNELPASYVAFDLLAVAGRDIRHHALSVRRALLEELASTWTPPLSLSPGTLDRTEALEWAESMGNAGIEGLVAKALDAPYAAGQREWIKVKRRDTIDVVAGAVIGRRSHPEAVVVGVYVDGQLRIAGRSTALPSSTSRALGELLEAPKDAHPWPATVAPGAVDRFNAGRDPVTLTLVEPIVVEISADAARSGYSFRHAVRFLRARPELDARTVISP